MHQRHLNMQQLSTNGVQQHQRRRKKRPNYGTRTVEVHRGFNGFGFTISGQQPCRLSCIVADSPADQAGLRNGDFLISINGLNVSKLPHETVVQLIGNSFGSIRMQIAENYYSDSSDEENAAAANASQQQQQQQQRQLQQQQQQQHQLQQTYNSSNWRGAKPRYLHHRIKMQQRMRNSPQKKRAAQQLLLLQQQQQQQQRQQQCEALAINAVSTCAAAAALEIQSLRPLMEDMPLPLKHNSGNSSSNRSHKSVSPNVANVSAIVRVPTAALEYRAIVGYMGTIEMPKQISHSSKLQTVRSCIRKLRQEKRQPTTVLMTILPDCLRLQSANGNILASYNSSRLNYVSSSSESENRFFGLITSAVHTDDKDEDLVDDLATDEAANTPACHISISNSCHVFVVDTKICDHQQHLTRASEFRILCTRDPISSLCLEFPNNSEYVVNLIRSMYTMRIIPPATRHLPPSNAHINDERAMGAAAAHSPQPSNHSEISTTTSNSDSGIGFHNDCNNISDRILVVDFPGVHELRMRHAAARPAGIFNNFDPGAPSVNCNNSSSNNNTNNNNNIDKRLTVRAMPDPKTPTLNRPDLLANFSLIKSPANSLTATRSCDDVLALMERGFHAEQQQLQQRSDDDTGDLVNAQLTHASMNDISLHASASNTEVEKYEQHIFLHPTVYTQLPRLSSSVHTPSKLSPQVFVTPNKTALNNIELKSNNVNNHLETAKAKTTRYSIGFQAVDVSNKRAAMAFSFDLDTWSSLQNLHQNVNKSNDLDITNSEPDLGVCTYI